jgi:hypothetical protein
VDRPVAGGVLIGTDCAREEGAQRLPFRQGEPLVRQSPILRMKCCAPLRPRPADSEINELIGS